MRLLLALQTQPGTVLPAHYNYLLSAAVYSLLRFGSREFADFLHDIGFRLNGHSYKMFTFALRFEHMRFENNMIRMLTPRAELFITSPLVEEFINSVVMGTFEQQYIRIGRSEFSVERIETLPVPQLNSHEKFTMLSPIVLSTKREREGTLYQYYLRPEDREDINRVLTNNLARKYEILTGLTPKDASVELLWDKQYMARHERVTRRVTIEESGRAIDIIGIQAPFTLQGAPELIQVGYECGFGEKNAMGFGMAKVI